MESISLPARTNTAIHPAPLACKSASTLAANMSLDVNVTIQVHMLPANIAAVMPGTTPLHLSHTTTVPVLEAQEERGRDRERDRGSVVRNMVVMRLKNRLVQHSLVERLEDVSDMTYGF